MMTNTKGLFCKDLMVIWQTRWMLLLISLLVCSLLLYYEQPYGLISYFTLFLAMQGVTSVVSDRSAGWTLYQTSFPISRSAAIREKYLLSLGLGLAGFAFGCLMAWISHPKGGDLMIINICMAALLGFSVMAIAIPLGLRLPNNQYFLVMIASFVLPAILIAFWANSLSAAPVAPPGNGLPLIQMNYRTDLLFWMAAGCFLLWAASFLICPKILARLDQH